MLIHHNKYRTDSLAEDIIDYDATVTRYNETREGATSTNDWVGHMVGYYREMMNYRMLEALHRRGFDLKR